MGGDQSSENKEKNAELIGKNDDDSNYVVKSGFQSSNLFPERNVRIIDSKTRNILSYSDMVQNVETFKLNTDQNFPNFQRGLIFELKCVRFHTDKKLRLISAGVEIVVFHLENFKIESTVKYQRLTFEHFDYYKGILVGCSTNCEVCVWRLNEDRPIFDFVRSFKMKTRNVRIGPVLVIDDSRLVLQCNRGTNPGEVTLVENYLNKGNKQKCTIMYKHSYQMYSNILQLRCERNILIVGGIVPDVLVRIDMKTKRSRRFEPIHSNSIRKVDSFYDFEKKDELIISAGEDKRFVIWNRNGKVIHEIKELKEGIFNFVFVTNDIVILGGTKGTVFGFSVSDPNYVVNKLHQAANYHANNIRAMTLISNQGKVKFGCCFNKDLQIFSLEGVEAMYHGPTEDDIDLPERVLYVADNPSNVFSLNLSNISISIGMIFVSM